MKIKFLFLHLELGYILPVSIIHIIVYHMFEGINKLLPSEKKLRKESQFSFPGKEKKTDRPPCLFATK